jgi:hypothetical protein
LYTPPGVIRVLGAVFQNWTPGEQVPDVQCLLFKSFSNIQCTPNQEALAVGREGRALGGPGHGTDAPGELAGGHVEQANVPVRHGAEDLAVRSPRQPVDLRTGTPAQASQARPGAIRQGVAVAVGVPGLRRGSAFCSGRFSRSRVGQQRGQRDGEDETRAA